MAHACDPLRNAPDDTLAARSRAGDPRALAELYRRYASPILAHVARSLGDPEEARDVLQETFLRLLHEPGRFEPRGRLRAWLFTVATHLAIDRMKSRRRRAELLASVELPQSAPPAPDLHLERTELAGRVEAVLRELPEAQARAFRLRVREAFSYREIAEIEGDAEGTLRSRVHHALSKVRAALLSGEPPSADAAPSPEVRPRGGIRLSEASRPTARIVAESPSPFWAAELPSSTGEESK